MGFSLSNICAVSRGNTLMRTLLSITIWHVLYLRYYIYILALIATNKFCRLQICWYVYTTVLSTQLFSPRWGETRLVKNLAQGFNGCLKFWLSVHLGQPKHALDNLKQCSSCPRQNSTAKSHFFSMLVCSNLHKGFLKTCSNLGQTKHAPAGQPKIMF